jgi:hypothetical protein
VDDLCANGNTQLTDLVGHHYCYLKLYYIVNLTDLIQGITQITLPSSPTTVDLQKILNVIAKKRFSDTFGYDYDGTSSSPTDKDPTKTLVLGCTSFFNASSPTTDQISSFVKVRIMKYVSNSLLIYY